MSPLPQPIRPLRRPPVVERSDHRADVIPIRPTSPERPVVSPIVDTPGDETVVLGRAVPYLGPTSAEPAAAPLDWPLESPIVAPIAAPVGEAAIIDEAGILPLLGSGGDRHDVAPPPPRVRYRPPILSSVLIAGGGIGAVATAGTFSEVPLVATVALLAIIVCGAVLVAAQITQEIRRFNHR